MSEQTMQPQQPQQPESRRYTAFIDPRKTRFGLFILSSICVLACVVVSILAIWDYTHNDAAYKLIASCGVLIGGGILFELLNRKFGDLSWLSK